MSLENSMREIGVIKDGHFKLESGRHSDCYIYKDQILHNPRLTLRMISMFVNTHQHILVDFITGPSMAGTCFAAMYAVLVNKPFVCPDKVVEDGVTRFRFRVQHKRFIKGKSGLIIDDIIKTGESIEDLVAEMIHCKAEPKKVFCIWNIGGWQELEHTSLINTKLDSWAVDECPMCVSGVPLIDPDIDM